MKEKLQMTPHQYTLLRLKQEEIENTNRPFTSHEIKSVIKENPSKKRERPEPDSITGEF